MRELESIMHLLHEIETDAEAIDDVRLRGYILEQIEAITPVRRFLAEEVRWDVGAGKES